MILALLYTSFEVSEVAIAQFDFTFSELINLGEISWLIRVLVYAIIGFYITGRLTYLLPALAIDQPFNNTKDCWHFTRGKAWIIFKFTFLISCPLLVSLVIPLYIVFPEYITQDILASELSFMRRSISIFIENFYPRACDLSIIAIAFLYKFEEKFYNEGNNLNNSKVNSSVIHQEEDLTSPRRDDLLTHISQVKSSYCIPMIYSHVFLE